MDGKLEYDDAILTIMISLLIKDTTLTHTIATDDFEGDGYCADLGIIEAVS